MDKHYRTFEIQNLFFQSSVLPNSSDKESECSDNELADEQSDTSAEEIESEIEKCHQEFFSYCLFSIDPDLDYLKNELLADKNLLKAADS
jgi:hypothetical protein